MPSSPFTSASAAAATADEAAALRGQGPLPARVALHLHVGAAGGGGEARARRLLVHVARLQLEQVHLRPRQGQQPRRRGGVERCPLALTTLPAWSRTS